MEREFRAALRERRTLHGINKEISVSDEKIEEILDFTIQYSPTAFNSQSVRAILLLKDHHDKLWDNIKDVMRGECDPEKFPKLEKKLNGYKNGYGTLLFFEDLDTQREFQEKFPKYKDLFPDWGHHSSGMAQLVAWTALEEAGLGVSLQHYNPVIDEMVQKQCNISPTWKLIAQMPFGNPTEGPGEKSFKPVEERRKIFK